MKRYKKIIYIILIIIMFMLFNNVYAAERCKTCNGSGYIGGYSSQITCPTCGGRGVTTGSSGSSGSTGSTQHTAGEIVDEADKFIDTGSKDANNKINPMNLVEMSDTIYNILLVAGIIIAIIVGLILGIRFIMGSIEEKAEIKAMIIPYIIGCVVVFGAFAIWKVVVDILQSM